MTGGWKWMIFKGPFQPKSWSEQHSSLPWDTLWIYTSPKGVISYNVSPNTVLHLKSRRISSVSDYQETQPCSVDDLKA